MHDLLSLSMLALAGLLIAVWIVIISIKRYEFAIFLIILSPWISAIFVPNSFAGIDAEDATIGSYLRIMLVMLIGFVGIIKYLQERSVDFEPVPRHLILLAIFCLLAVLSTAYSIDRRFTFIRSVSFIPFFCFLLGLSQWLRGWDQANKMLNSVFYAICFYLVVNVVAMLILPGRVWWYVDTSRFMGLWSQPNQMGGFCMIAYPVLFWKMSNADSRMKWFVAFLILITAVFHILTGSRTTLIAAALGTCIWLIVARKPFKFILMIVLLSVFAMAVMIFRPSNLTRDGGFESLSTFTGRTEIWTATLTLAKERPIIGYGFGVGGKVFEDPRFYNPKEELWSGTAKVSLHNGYLSSLISLGIPGTLLLYYLLILPFFRSRKALKGEFRALALTVLFMCFLTNFLEAVIGGSSGVVSLVLWILWIIAGKISAFNKVSFSHLYSQTLEVNPA
jgi:O-antigen ligase